MENRMWKLLIGAMNGESVTVMVEEQQKRELKNIAETKLLPIQCGRGKEEEQNEYREWLQASGITVVEQYDDLMMRVILPNEWTFKEDGGGYWTYVLDEKGRKRASFFYKGVFYDRDSFLHFSRRFSVYGYVADYNQEDFREKPKFIQDGFEDVWVDEEEYRREHSQVRPSIVWNEWEEEDGTIKVLVQKPKYVENPDYVKMHGKEEYSQPFHYEVRDHDGAVLFHSDIVATDFEWTQEKHDAFWRNREEKEKQIREQCLAWINTHYPKWEDVLAYWNE